MACVTNSLKFGCLWMLVGIALFFFLPWWLALVIFVVPIIAGGVVGVVMLSTLMKFAKGIKEAVEPKETLHEVAAGQSFKCVACTFTLPVAARVWEMAGHGVSMVRMEPAITAASPEYPPMILVSNCMSVPDMQKKIESIFQAFAQRAPAAEITDWEPAPELGPTGQVRRIRIEKNGVPMQFRAAFTGEGESLLAWMVIAPADGFETVYGQVRDLAKLVQPIPQPITVKPESAGNVDKGTEAPQ